MHTDYFSTYIFVCMGKLCYTDYLQLSRPQHDDRNLPRWQRHHLRPAGRHRRSRRTPWGSVFGNPSSSHATGLKAKAMLDQARACASAPAGRRRRPPDVQQRRHRRHPDLGAVGAGRAARAPGARRGHRQPAWSTAPPSTRPCRKAWAHWNRLLGLNLELHKLPVDQQGVHDLAQLRALAPQAALVCTMAANNETGVVTDLAGIEVVLAETGAGRLLAGRFACRRWAMLDLDLQSTRIDYAPFSATSCTRQKASACCTCAPARRSRR